MNHDQVVFFFNVLFTFCKSGVCLLCGLLKTLFWKVDEPSSWNLMYIGVWSSKEPFTLDPEEGGSRAVGSFVCNVCSSSKGDLYGAESARVNLLMHIHTGLTSTHIVCVMSGVIKYYFLNHSNGFITSSLMLKKHTASVCSQAPCSKWVYAYLSNVCT